MDLGWVGIGIMMFAAFLFGIIVCALFASNAYDRGWRDAVRSYRKEHSDW